MNTITKLGILLGMAGMLSYAENWSGKLIDSSCYDSKATASSTGQKAVDKDKLDKDCAATASTTTFAVHVNGKVYKLDASGNAKAAADMQGGAIKPDKDGDVHVSVTGSLQGETVKVDSLKGRDK